MEELTIPETQTMITTYQSQLNVSPNIEQAAQTIKREAY